MKLVKKSMAVLLAVVMICSLVSAAGAVGQTGTCGPNATWELSALGALSIKGGGEMRSYAPSSKSDYKQYASKIKTVKVNGMITNIGAYAFQGMPALTTVKLEDGVARISKFAFADCPVLSSVTLVPSLVFIASSAFSNCPSLKNIVIPEKIETLYSKTFAGCTSLETIEVQNKDCVFAASDILPKNVTVVGYKGPTAQAYAEKNGLAFREIGSSSTDQPTTPTQPVAQPTTDAASTADAGKCPLCGQTHEGFPGSLIGGIHNLIYGLLALFGMRK